MKELQEAITAVEEERFSDFSKIITTSLSDKFRNNPKVQEMADREFRMKGIQDAFRDISRKLNEDEKPKFKVGNEVIFYGVQGDKDRGIISKSFKDDNIRGEKVYFYDIETKSKLVRDVPEGDISRKLNEDELAYTILENKLADRELKKLGFSLVTNKDGMKEYQDDNKNTVWFSSHYLETETNDKELKKKIEDILKCKD